MILFPQLIPTRILKNISAARLQLQLKSVEARLYQLGQSISQITKTEHQTPFLKGRLYFYNCQLGYYFSVYEKLYEIWLEVSKNELIAKHPRMKALFDNGTVKDVQHLIELAKNAKQKRDSIESTSPPNT
ncbi:hypothetical protein SAMN05444266_102100 [Chitinophaga jiangningensis]|uniref:Uncharacterized protein n=1 Tax=Chitinophaga jiangningensis TaxID=1419482 RepID=A0A1M6Y0N6_9BACT|nr:hypothetical protein [Chitinophaga jiangningensis]SHL11780.1 hypothetical protein SAMN05444266_102100 [Chitinophaga jiangningensis]